jgi:hypothetical protein
MTTIARLQKWYVDQCDGHWEHAYGIKILTLDNPGWSITIDLEGTPLEGRAFEKVSIERAESDWLVCRVEKEQFLADGGPGNLDEMLLLFLDWSTIP